MCLSYVDLVLDIGRLTNVVYLDCEQASVTMYESIVDSFKTALKTFLFTANIYLYLSSYFLMLLDALFEWLCTAHLNRLPCYGALEIIMTLLILLYKMLNNGCNDFLFGVHCVEEGDRIPPRCRAMDRR